VADKRLVAALMEILVSGVATVQEEEVCRGERKAGRRRERESRWLLGGCVGFLWWSWWWRSLWWLWLVAGTAGRER
jgi:hypothetical protein